MNRIDGSARLLSLVLAFVLILVAITVIAKV